jgi:parallel beta-helix repeat protein
MIPSRKAVVSIGLLVIAGTVQAATSITTCPFVITSPGDYLLSADLICGGGDGISITSGNVTLKLEGHRITAGVGASRAIVVNPLFTVSAGVRILGPGLITNGGGNTFSVAVRLINGPNAEVSGITMLGSGAGIITTGCNFMTITANTLGRNATGILLGDSPFSTISNNDVSGNGTGIRLTLEGPPSTGTVSHNVLNGNTVGLFINFETGATVQNNVINGNSQYGIFVAGATFPLGLQVINNTSLANGNNDLFDDAPDCSGHVWSGNTFFNANQSCIH